MGRYGWELDAEFREERGFPPEPYEADPWEAKCRDHHGPLYREEPEEVEEEWTWEDFENWRRAVKRDEEYLRLWR